MFLLYEFKCVTSIYQPFLDGIPVLGYYANSADLVQTPQNAACDQGLHCLLSFFSMENTLEMNTNTRNP